MKFRTSGVVFCVTYSLWWMIMWDEYDAENEFISTQYLFHFSDINRSTLFAYVSGEVVLHFLVSKWWLTHHSETEGETKSPIFKEQSPFGHVRMSAIVVYSMIHPLQWAQSFRSGETYATVAMRWCERAGTSPCFSWSLAFQFKTCQSVVLRLSQHARSTKIGK